MYLDFRRLNTHLVWATYFLGIPKHPFFGGFRGKCWGMGSITIWGIIVEANACETSVFGQRFFFRGWAEKISLSYSPKKMLGPKPLIKQCDFLLIKIKTLCSKGIFGRWRCPMYDPYEKFVVLSVQFGPTNFQVSHEKHPAILSIESWLVNRDSL